MQDPSQGVAAPLQNHVHLISGHRFPLLQSIPISQVVKYLLDAPTIVKQIAPMSWQYLSAPSEGTLWLEWIPQHKNNQPYSSDGYIWADPETTYHDMLGGFEIEILVHSSGYRPGQDQISSHARTRYHFVRKEPQVAAPPPDPSLWIVHYHRAEQNRHIPVNQVPINAQVQQVIQQRRWLESQGRLERRDFMLHDREHWPIINVPNAAHMNQQMQHPVQQRQYYPAGPGQPPAKRLRQSGPNPMPPTMEAMADQSIEEEENTAFGDFFDHVSPRDISMARYMQHHRWIEEVFSSPYASGQIVPADLGLGLMGTLKGLTEGILEPPNVDIVESQRDKAIKQGDAVPFTNLKQEQIDEFNKRVQKHLEDGRTEIEKMKSDHLKRMQEWKKARKLSEAEKKLRFAKWDSQVDGVSMFRVEDTATNGNANGHAEPKQTIEDLVRGIEKELRVKIEHQDEAKMIEKGGLEREERPVREPSMQPEVSNDFQPSEVETTSDQPKVTVSTLDGSAPQQSESSETQAQPSLQQPGMPQTATPALTPQAQASGTPSDLQQRQSTAPPPTLAEQKHHQPFGGDSTGPSPGMDDVNMDIGDSAFDFEHEIAAQGVDNPTPQAASTTTTQQEQSNPEPTPSQQQQQQQQSNETQPLLQPQQQQDQPPTTSATPASTAPTTASTEAPATSHPTTMGGDNSGVGGSGADAGDVSMFNDNTFGDLADFGADDGLVDFDGGMGMDNAFGDAIQGMDTPNEGGGGDEGAGGN